MVAQASLGLLLPGQYRDAGWIRATWFGNDWVTLIAAAPLLAVAIARASRGSARGLLLLAGGLGYAIYNYAFYLLGAALNAFFLLYVVLVLLSSVALILTLTSRDAGRLSHALGPGAPLRVLGGYFAFVAAGLASVWIALWAAHVFGGRPTPVEPEAFRLVAALDLSLMVPALATGGVLLWRRHRWGLVIAGIAGVQGSLYLLVLSVNGLVLIGRGLAEAPGELPIWGTLALGTTAATGLLIGSVRVHAAEARGE